MAIIKVSSLSPLFLVFVVLLVFFFQFLTSLIPTLFIKSNNFKRVSGLTYLFNRENIRSDIRYYRQQCLMATIENIKPTTIEKKIILTNTNDIESANYNGELTLEQIQASYNGEKISQYYNSRPIQVVERLIEIGSPLLLWWIERKIDNITAPFHSKEENMRRLNLRAEQLKNCIVSGKSVTFIKSGQALALRPDLVKSAEYVRELQKLQDEVGTFDNEIAMNIIEDELGLPADEIYEFNPKLPIASASIGQVYRAKLKSTGRLVAVKVQRPDALQYAALDMFILRTIAGFIKKQKKLNSDLVGIADEFGMQLYNELNYNQEATNCLRFRSLYGTIPGIYVPDIELKYTATRVLTMEFVEGTKGPWPTGGERMLTVGLQCSVLQLLGTGFFHSDPHRGNLLQTPDGKLCYLDFGMMSEVPAEKRFALIGSVLGLVNKDVSMVVNSMKELQFFPPETDTGLIISSLNSALMNSTDDGSGTGLNFTKLNSNLERISDILPFRLPPFYTLIIRSLTILEGLALFVDPEFRLIRGAYPFIARQILYEPTPEMNNFLKSILLNENGRIKWDKLEQFVSISSNADAAVKGDFSALKNAQDRSDLLKTYQGQQLSSNFTTTVTMQIVDYLLSENGQYLRDPLIFEIVETIDSFGLTAVAIASLLSNRIIPEPIDKPDKQRVIQFFKLFDTLSSNGVSSSKEFKDIIENDDVSSIDAERIIRLGANIYNYIQNPQNFKQLNDLQPILSKSTVLVKEIIIQLIEKNARRLVRTVFSPNNIKTSLPVISRTIDLIPKV